MDILEMKNTITKILKNYFTGWANRRMGVKREKTQGS